MKSLYLQLICLSVCLIALLPNSFATHALGGNLTYTSTVNPNEYEFTYTFFRDYDGIQAAPSYNLLVQTSSCGFSSLLLGQVSLIDVTELCPGETSTCNGGTVQGVQEAIYKGLLTLPSSCGASTVSYNLCCRNNEITTLNNPGSESLYLEVVFQNNVANNSSPQFANAASFVSCLGQPVTYNQGAGDPDGDDLVYSLQASLEGPSNPVEYATGYSATAPLTTSGGVNVDPTTGTITFNPTIEQVGVLRILVEEYRNGVKIGEVSRDIQFEVEDCGSSGVINQPPTIAGPFTYMASPGVQLCLPISGADPDGDPIIVSFNNGITTGTFTPPLSTMPTAGISTQFCYTPAISQALTSQTFTLTIEDDQCPLAGSNTYGYTIMVGPPAPPIIVCPADITIECNEDSSSMNTGQATATGFCGSLTTTITYSDVSTQGTTGGSRYDYTITRTWTATDDCSTTSTCSQIISVEDNTPPVVVEMSGTQNTSDDGTGDCTFTPTTSGQGGTYSIADNCASLLLVEEVFTGALNTTATFSLSPGTWTPAQAFPVGVTTVTVTVTDDCGNSSTDSYTTTIIDDEAPTVTCVDFTTTLPGCPGSLGSNTPNGNWILIGPDLAFASVSGGSFSIPVDLSSCVSDNCTALEDMEYMLFDSYEENRTGCQVTLVNEFSIRDASGLISPDKVVTRITIEDVEQPVVTCADFTSTQTGCPDGLGPNTPSGNWQNVPASGLVQTAVGGSYVATIDLNCITDNCGPVGDLEIRLTRSFEENRVPGCSVDILNEFEVRDGCGNVSPDLILYRGQIRFDGPPPVLVIPPAIRVECGTSTAPAVTGMATASSGCGTPVVTFSDQVTPFCGLTETITRTWLATDACGKTSTATQLVITEDTTPPTITGAPEITVNCDDDQTPAGTGTPVATDVCSATPPALVFADDVRPGACPGNYTIRRTWTATDECFNSSSYLQIITVQDIVGPVFAQAPGDLDANLTNVALDAFGSGLCLTALDVTGLEAAINAGLTADATGITGISFPTPTDACSDPIVTTATVVVAAGAAQCFVLIDVTYTSTDACGNTSDYLQQLNVIDVAPPVLTVPAPNVTVECDMPTDVAATGSPVYVDECPGAIVTITNADVEIADPNCPNGKTTIRTFTATDPCGNTSIFVQVITVVDTEAPVYTSFPRDTTVECSSLSGMMNTAINAKGLADAQGFPTVEDNCSTGLLAPFTDVFTLSTNCPTVGIYERIFAPIDDGCGNILPERTLTITVIDTMAPIFTSIPIGGDFDCTVGIPPVGTATAVDCDPNVVVTEVDEVTIVGINQVVSITERTITARDSCGNETVQVETYRVLDQAGPFLISCPTDIGPIVARPDDRARVTFATPVFDDNCSFSVSGTHVSGQDFPVGLTQVVYTATDEGGNITICEFTIEVVKALNLTCLDQNISVDSPNDLSRSDINFPYPSTDCDACPQGEPLPSLDYLGHFRGHRYYVSAAGDTRSWTEAQRHAVSLGGRLVEVNSAEENLFLQRELPYAQALIGHYTGPRTSTWTGTFSPEIYENWASGFPTTGTNEFFALLSNSDGTHTNANHSEMPYIVEFPCVKIEVIGMTGDSLFSRGPNVITYAAEDQCGNRDTCEYAFNIDIYDVVYCSPTVIEIGQEEDYYITNVSVGAFAKTLTANSSFYQLRDTVEIDEDVATTISLSAETSGMEGASFPAYWRVWVDANKDGDFYDDGEMIYEEWGDAKHAGSITLPSSLSTINPTRIRIAFSRYAYPEPCGDIPFGAVVDFSLKSNSTTLPRLALTGARGMGLQTLTTTSQEEPEIDSYLMLRGANPDELTKIDFWMAAFGDNQHHTYEMDDLDPMPSAYYQSVALDDQGVVIRSSNIVHLTMPMRRDPVRVFPNPAVHQVYIDFGHGDLTPKVPVGTAPKGDIKLYDALGRIIQTQTFELGVKQIRMNLPRLATGAYMLRITRPNMQAKNIRIMIDQNGGTTIPRA